MFLRVVGLLVAVGLIVFIVTSVIGISGQERPESDERYLTRTI